MEKVLIPENYEQWHHCITVICKQPLTPAYLDQRLRALNNLEDYMTKKFVELYGEQQRMKTLQWFERAKHTIKNH